MPHASRVEPDLKIAEKVLPKPLLRAIQHIFAQNISHTSLVGGTALAGFYAGHRRSDDIDLFTQSPESKNAAIRAVESLQAIGAQLTEQMNSTHYYRALCKLENHLFTIDVVLDKNLFSIGKFNTLDDNVTVADLDTLYRMKAATLVSRCSEKDLYDLIWLFDHYLDSLIDISELIKSALSIDLGATVEGLLMSLSGASLSKEACDFGLRGTSTEVFEEINNFRKNLIRLLREYDSGQTSAPLKNAVKNLKKIN